jgi:hypothetical protein
MRTCSACRKPNPAGFSYCGFCASPMETTELRARIADVAAPPGGWPNLTTELVQVRFYLQQGLLDDAYELISILQQRHPGHPELADFARKVLPVPADEQVDALVDSVLADSANLGGRIPRRAVPRWDGAEVSERERTSPNETVARETTDAPPPRERTRIYRTVEAPRRAEPTRPAPARPAPQTGMTVAVPTLAAPAPFEQRGAADEQRTTGRQKAGKKAAKESGRRKASEPAPASTGKRKKAEEASTGRRKKAEAKPAEDGKPRRSVRIGEHVLGRLR